MTKFTVNSSPRRLRPLACCVLFAVLSGCLSAKQQCDRRYLARVDTLTAQVKEAHTSIARGYRLHTQTTRHQGLTLCYTFDDGYLPCLTASPQRIETPVSVDMAHERDRLAQLETSLHAAQEEARKGVDASRKTYRE